MSFVKEYIKEKEKMSSGNTLSNWLSRATSSATSEDINRKESGEGSVLKRSRQENSPENKRTKGDDTWDDEDEFIGLLKGLVEQVNQIQKQMMTKEEIMSELKYLQDEVKSINDMMYIQNQEII